MSFLREWLLGITGAALAVALAQAMTPAGTVKKVGRLAGGVVLLLAVVRPVLSLDPGSFISVPAFSVETEGVGAGGEEVMKTLIAQKAGAYIVDKGSALGCELTAEVTVGVDENGWPVPWRAEMTGTWTGEQKRALSRALAGELGIPEERQSYKEGG